MINRLILVGHLGKDPVVYSDGKVAKFSVATTHSYKDKKGEWVKETEWTDCVGFGGYAAAAMKPKKGDLVYVSGRKQTNKWTDKDGVMKYNVSLIIEEMRLLEKPKQTGPEAPEKPSVLWEQETTADLPF